MTKRLALALAFTCAPLLAQSVILNNSGKKPTVAIRNSTIYPVTSAPIANGTIVFANGVITAIGTNVAIPSGATVIDGAGLSVYPGLIDSGSQVGLTEVSSVAGTNDTSELGDLNPNARAEVAVNPHSNLIPVTRVNGITTVIAEPEGGIISGQSALIQLSGWTPKEMVLKAPVAMHIHFPRLRTVSFDEQPLIELRFLLQILEHDALDGGRVAGAPRVHELRHVRLFGFDALQGFNEQTILQLRRHLIES